MANPALSMRPYGTSGLTRGANTTTQQHREAQRLERERAERVERERMERAGQSQLGELSEEQREEINEAVCLFCNAYEKKRVLEPRNTLVIKNSSLIQAITVSTLRPRPRQPHRLPRTKSRHESPRLRPPKTRNNSPPPIPRRARLLLNLLLKSRRHLETTYVATYIQRAPKTPLTLNTISSAHGNKDISERSERRDIEGF